MVNVSPPTYYVDWPIDEYYNAAVCNTGGIAGGRVVEKQTLVSGIAVRVSGVRLCGPAS